MRESTTRDFVFDCIETLNESWQTGMQSILGCSSCDDVVFYLAALAE